MKRLSKGREKELRLSEYFIPLNCRDCAQNRSFLGLTTMKRSRIGVDADDAFFLHSERGIKPSKVKNPKRLIQLMFGHKRIALNVAMWKEDFAQCMLFPEDFLEEPDYIKLLAKQVYENVTNRAWVVDNAPKAI